VSYIPLYEIIEQIDAIEGCESTKRKIKSLFNAIAGARIYANKKPLNTSLIDAATALVKAGTSRNESAKALQSRYSVCKKTAYRLINEAIHKKHKPQPTQGALF
jgi:hypothetical protein